MIEQHLKKLTPAEERAAYDAVTYRDGNLCQRCRRDCGGVQRDHRKNRSRGGRTEIVNLQLLGARCHDWKTNHPHEAVREGWAVPGWPTADPAQWPARRWIPTGFGTVRLAWVLLRDGRLTGVWWEEISTIRALTLLEEGGVEL